MSSAQGSGHEADEGGGSPPRSPTATTSSTTTGSPPAKGVAWTASPASPRGAPATAQQAAVRLKETDLKLQILEEKQKQYESRMQLVISEILQTLRENGKTLKDAFAKHAKDSQTISRAAFRVLLEQECGIYQANQQDEAVLDFLIAKTSQNHRDDLRYTEVFKEFIVENVVHNLKLQHRNLRVLFHQYDKQSYGYLTVPQFHDMLHELCRLSDSEIEFLTELVDEHQTGRIDYHALFYKFYQTPATITRRRAWMHSKQHTIRSVILVVRHGARYPLKCFPKNVHWPRQPQFWKSYGGRLTPVGSQQLFKLGQRLRDKYIARELLLDDQTPDLSLRVRAYTSNQDRTLMSAQSLFLGMFPGTCPRIVLDTEKSFAERQSKRKRPRLASIGVIPPPIVGTGLSIFVSSEDYSALLHGFKNSPAYTALRDRAFAEGKFAEWAEDDRFKDLATKLWKMTGFKKINPSKGVEHCLPHFQSLAQQLSIERAHQMELLKNSEGIALELADEESLNEVAEYICRLRYQGKNDAEQRKLARLAAGTLPVSIVNSLVAAARSDDKAGSFTLYSAHDNTILAMLAHLGLKDVPIPRFGAHLAFELHDVNGEHFVKLLYNPDVEFQGFPDNPLCKNKELKPCSYITVPPQDEIVSWDDRQEGVMKLADFEESLLVHRHSLLSEDEWVAVSHGKEIPTTSPGKAPPVRSKSPKLSLTGFQYQVAGHEETIFALGPKRIVKPFSDREHHFYELVFGGSGLSDGLDSPAQPASRSFQLDEPVSQHPMLAFVPKYYGTLSFDESDVKSKGAADAGGPGLKAVPELPSVEVTGPEDAASSSPRLSAFVRKRATPDGPWKRRWVVLENGIVTWFKDANPGPQEQSLGSFDLKAEFVEVIKPNDARLQEIHWPRVAGAGLGLMDIFATMHALHFVTFDSCMLWLRAFQEILAGGGQPGGSESPSAQAEQLLQAEKLAAAAFASVQEAKAIVQQTQEFVARTNLTVSRRSTVGSSSVAVQRARRRAILKSKAPLHRSMSAEQFSELLQRHTPDPAPPAQRARPGPCSENLLRRSLSSSPPATKPYLMLENLVSAYEAPCILDLKMGVRQHADDATPEKRERQILKCYKTTSRSLGIRCSGMRVWNRATSETHTYSKEYGRSLARETFKTGCLTKFLDNGYGLREDVINGILPRLEGLIEVVKNLEGYRFYSASLLVAYDGASQAGLPSPPTCHMIDFAKTMTPCSSAFNAEVHVGADEGLLFGLHSLRKLLQELTLGHSRGPSYFEPITRGADDTEGEGEGEGEGDGDGDGDGPAEDPDATLE